MNNILNLNQSPEEIANEAKQIMEKLTTFSLGKLSESKVNQLATVLIENMKYVCIKTWNGVESADYTKLSKVLEILNKEIKI